MSRLLEKNLETGHPLLDAQHRDFFEALDELRDAGRGNSLKRVNETFAFFTYYTAKHFFDEEGLQIYYGYPGYAVHRACHDYFKNILYEFGWELREKKLAADVSGKILFFTEWLPNHIENHDFELALHIRKFQKQSVA